MRFRDRLTPTSRLRFYAWWILGGWWPIILQLKNGPRIRMRSLVTTDYGVAVDVFHKRCYDIPCELGECPRIIVDLGANVGYSVLHWLHRAPKARVIAFEPHPAHVEAIRENLAINGLLSKVDLWPAAVGSRGGTAVLSDCGSSSSIVNAATGFTVPVVDLYEAVLPPVDILKVDIEGAEYDLLDDPRLSMLAPRTLVIEWHGSGGYERLRNRLASLGYAVTKTSEGPHQTGLLWAYREATPAGSS